MNRFFVRLDDVLPENIITRVSHSSGGILTWVIICLVAGMAAAAFFIIRKKKK